MSYRIAAHFILLTAFANISCAGLLQECVGVESKDEAVEVNSLRKAAEHGNAGAMYKLGLCYFDGVGGS